MQFSSSLAITWDPGLSLVGANAVALGIISYLGIPACQELLLRTRHNEQTKAPPRYHDENGEATSASIQTYLREESAIVTISLTQTVLTCILCFWDIESHQANPSIFATTHRIQMTIWGLLLIQSIALWRGRSYITRFSLDLRGALSQLVAGLALTADLYIRIQQGLTISTPQWLQLGLTVATCVCHLLIPRRPQVFRNRVLVSPEYAASALSRICFKWAEPLLQIGGLSRTLEVNDLPEIPIRACARDLDDVFARRRQRGERFTSTSFLWTILSLHWCTLHIYLLLTALVTALDFTAQAFMFLVLQELDQRSHRDFSEATLWIYVAGLISSRLILSPLNAYRYWVAHSAFNLGTTQHLNVAIFSKALSLNLSSNTDTYKRRNAPDHTKNQSPHHIVNLLSVDVANASGVVYTSASIFWTPLRLFISFQALAHLLSWHSAVVGIGAFALSLFISARPAKRQAKARQTLLGHRDHKMTFIAEAFRGIRQIKFLTLEARMQARINRLRDAELEALWRLVVWDLVTRTLYLVSPTILSVVSLGTHALLNGGLTPATAFTAISILNTVQDSMSAIPTIVNSLIGSFSSSERLADFFNAPEKVDVLTPADGLEFRNATISYSGTLDDHGTGHLKDVNLIFPRGELSVITGPTGTGKSLLLAGVLGECHLLQGTIHTPIRQCRNAIGHESWLNRSVAYVSQSPWLETASVKDNILFGLPYNELRYKEAVHACALEPDMKMFPDADLTQLGPNGVNLSGGQKWRITLARALYSRALVLVLDDIFSAVDVHTARHLHEYALTGPLTSGRTRILVTHNIELCRSDIKYLVALNHNGVAFAGKTTDYLGSDPSVADPQKCGYKKTAEGIITSRATPIFTIHEQNKQGKNTTRQFMSNEHREKGLVRWSVLQNYIQSSGTTIWWIWTTVSFIVYGSMTLTRTWWLGIWSQSSGSSATSWFTGFIRADADNPSLTLRHFFFIYLIISMLVVMLSVVRVYVVSAGAHRASYKLFRRLLHRTLRAPLLWTDTVPLGRILSRFSTDFDMIDTQLRNDIQEILACSVDITMVTISGIAINPLLLILACILVRYAVRDARRYLAAAQEVKRLDSVMRSPIIDHLSSCLNGLWTIRASGNFEAYKSQMGKLIDRRTRTSWNSALLNHWLEVRMSMLGTIFVASSAALIVSLRGVDAASAGFAITFALRLASSMQFTVGRCKSLELDLNAVERVLEYSNIEMERDGDDCTLVPPNWPSQGTLEVSNLVVRYAPDLPPVLDQVSFAIGKNERVGIVGRTGAGKSSLVLALFRLLEASQGHIKIDGVDISAIRLQDLRSRLAIIPQNPTLFKGTVRSNLDLFNEYDDKQLLRALAQVHWNGMADQKYEREAIISDGEIPASPLDLVVGEGGENLSQGQRQLVCLARAIAQEPQILILDEATSAVDQETDAKIQHSLRSEFRRGSTTLLVVAHRLSTVVDFDKIIVLGGGQVLEFGSPSDLIRRNLGVFKGMVQEDAEADTLMKKIYGKIELS